MPACVVYYMSIVGLWHPSTFTLALLQKEEETGIGMKGAMWHEKLSYPGLFSSCSRFLLNSRKFPNVKALPTVVSAHRIEARTNPQYQRISLF
jgi:hypothetical protein